MDIQKKNSAGRSGGVFAACCCEEIRKMQKTKRHLFSTHLEFACKQSIHIEIWQVLNRYTKRNTVPMG